MSAAVSTRTQAGMRREQRATIAEGEARVRMRAAHGAQRQARLVRAARRRRTARAPVTLARAVHLRQARADRRAGRWRTARDVRRLPRGRARRRRSCGSRCSGTARRRARPAPRPRSGAGLRASRSVAAISMPGVQMPHCAAPWRRKARCNGARSSPSRQPLDGHDGAAGHLADRHQAGADLPSVEQHGAGAAIAGVAADLGAGEAEIVAQHVGEAARRIARAARPALPFRVNAIGSAGDLMRPPPAATREAATARRTSSSAAWRR